MMEIETHSIPVKTKGNCDIIDFIASHFYSLFFAANGI